MLDYFNSDWVRTHLIPAEDKTLDGIEFRLSKWITDAHVFKRVEFKSQGKEYHFQERVRLFGLQDFQMLMQQSGLSINAVYGDYNLEPFDAMHSKRMIILAEKR